VPGAAQVPSSADQGRESAVSERDLVSNEARVVATICSHCESASRTNEEILTSLVQQIRELQELLQRHVQSTCDSSAPQSTGLASEQIDELMWEIRQRDLQISTLQRELETAEQQRLELASRIANDNVRKVVQTADSSIAESLSWEERKQLILKQLEDDSFDHEAFLATLQVDENKHSSALNFVAESLSELEELRQELDRKDSEIRELHCLLEQQSGQREGGLAVGAAAIAMMLDEDSLVIEERARLKQLQAEWEEKFRQGEIEASLERAKLSRDRQELAKRQSEWELEVEHLQRELRYLKETATPENPTAGSSKRRWLQKLGISDTSNR
jgi:DNA repair exonuclease SbcCD ATPase subunit